MVFALSFWLFCSQAQSLNHVYLNQFTVDNCQTALKIPIPVRSLKSSNAGLIHLDSLGTLNAVVIFFLNLKAEKALTDHQLKHETVANAAGEKQVHAEGNLTISSMLSFNAR